MSGDSNMSKSTGGDKAGNKQYVTGGATKPVKLTRRGATPPIKPTKKPSKQS